MTPDKTTKIVIALGLVALLVAAGGVGYTLYKSYQERVMERSMLGFPPTYNYDIEKLIEKTDKQTYTNSDLGFSMQYPSAWPVARDMEKIGGNLRTYIHDGKYMEGCCSGVRLEVIDIAEKTLYEKYSDKENLDIKQSFTTISLGSMTVNEYVRITHYGDDERVTFVPLGNKTLEIGRGENDEAAEQIVKSFAFLAVGAPNQLLGKPKLIASVNDTAHSQKALFTERAYGTQGKFGMLNTYTITKLTLAKTDSTGLEPEIELLSLDSRTADYNPDDEEFGEYAFIIGNTYFSKSGTYLVTSTEGFMNTRTDYLIDLSRATSMQKGHLALSFDEKDVLFISGDGIRMIPINNFMQGKRSGKTVFQSELNITYVRSMDADHIAFFTYCNGSNPPEDDEFTYKGKIYQKGYYSLDINTGLLIKKTIPDGVDLHSGLCQ
ncbi:MAG: hypothetical protein Q8P11_03860 [bacterium]|nr:hypothetical protein [bacterium]